MLSRTYLPEMLAADGVVVDARRTRHQFAVDQVWRNLRLQRRNVDERDEVGRGDVRLDEVLVYDNESSVVDYKTSTRLAVLNHKREKLQ